MSMKKIEWGGGGGGGGGRHEGVIFSIVMIYTICNMHVYICKPANKAVTLSNEVEEHLTFFHMI